MSNSGFLFKLESIGVCGSVVSICSEFHSNLKQRVVVDGATSKWIIIVLDVPQGSVLGHLLFIFYTSEMFELVENRLYACADDSTLIAVIRKPADRSVAAVVNRDLVRIQVWCNHWCMILNPIKTMALVASGSRTVNPSHGDLVVSGVCIRARPNQYIVCVTFYSKLTFEGHVRGSFSCLSENWYFEVGDTYICGHFCVTSLLFCIRSPNP